MSAVYKVSNNKNCLNLKASPRLSNYEQIKNYLSSSSELNSSKKVLLMHLNKNDELVFRKDMPLSDTTFESFCIELLQSLNKYKTNKILVVKVEPEKSDVASKFKNFKSCRKLVSLAEILNIILVDFIIMKDAGFESFKFDHGSIGNCYEV